MYRDDLEALREKVRDLDRALAEARAKQPPPPDNGPTARETREVLFAFAAGVAILVGSIVHVAQTWNTAAAHQRLTQDLARQALVREWSSSGSLDAHIVSRERKGTACTIALSPPCHARVLCGGKLLYEGNGGCLPSGYIDRGDSWLDGTPQCEIDVALKRAVVREIGRRKAGTAYRDAAWQVDLELP